MARLTNRQDLSPTIDAAKKWIDTCLIEDGSLFSRSSLWTAEVLEEVRRAFVEHPDSGKDDFNTKLKGQMRAASAAAKQLMAEMLWVLLLFPTNLKPETKRLQIRNIWEWSGEKIPPDQPLLRDDVLFGIGSGGPGFNTHRWRELVFLIVLAGSLKRKATAERRHIFSDYDAFIEWIGSVPQEGHRQFQHMLRFFAFPDRVERMSSNGDRQRILERFSVAPERDTAKWNDRQFDDALLKLRRKLEGENAGKVLDFYESPLKARWQVEDEKVAEEEEPDQPRETAVRDLSSEARPVNLMFYGPPGTGKTYLLQQKFGEYTDAPNTVDRETWLQELVANYGWRPLIAATLAELKRPARVPEIRNQVLIQAKTKQRGRTAASVQATVWGYLQEHTPETVPTVKVSIRRPPFIFSKRETGEWELLPDWQELDEESAELARLLRAGPSAAREAIRRYRAVTFHPSFSYEDFIRGIRPVLTAEDGTTQFRVVDGIFKQICDEARANPSKRYGLFIDEINRANIAKVFGELITLIERDKRGVFDADGRLIAGMAVQLPGSQGLDVAEPPFAVPPNLDIFGTMNTADRSIALLDVALRRRFDFQEMEPNYSILNRDVASVNLSKLLRRINDRLQYLLDRDHRIGHAYLMPAGSLEDLRRVFRLQIIPLLQEYFFDDVARVAMVLATAPSVSPFVRREPLTYSDLFPGVQSESASTDRVMYVITPETTWTEDSFRGIYSSALNAEEIEESV